MTPDQTDKLAVIAGKLSGLAEAMRQISGDDLTERESNGLQVMAAETEAIVDGIKRLCSPALSQG